MRNYKPIAIGLGLFACGVVTGCGPGADLGRVSGVVRIDGQPYPGGKVIFTPVGSPGSNLSGQPALGKLGPDGRYELSTFGHGEGALIGDHTVSLFRAPNDSETRPDLSKLSFKRFNMRDGHAAVASGNNEFDFDITSDDLRRHGNRL